MKQLYSYILTIITALLMASCNESEVPLYSGNEGIYFNNRSAGQTLQDSTEFSFIYYDFTETTMEVKVQTYGRTKEYDRPINLTVTSENATEGVDYEVLDEAVVRAGESNCTLRVKLYKTSILSSETLKIDFLLGSNDFFSTDFPGTLHYSILFSNQYNVPPAGWVTMFGGTFMPEKLDLLVSLFPEVARKDYNDGSAITLAKWSYMQKTVTDYISQQIQYYMMGAPYDKLIFDHDGNMLDFTK